VELRRILGEDGEVFIRTSPPYEYGWRTGVEAIQGKKATVEEARACLLVEQEAAKSANLTVGLHAASRRTALPRPQETVLPTQGNKGTRTPTVSSLPDERPKPGISLIPAEVPIPRPNAALPSTLMRQNEDQEDVDEEYEGTSAPSDLPEERLPIGWEKKIAAVDRKWFVGETCDFITDDELKTYVRTMGWSESSNANRSEWLKTILHGLDRALTDGPKEKRDREDPQNNSPTVAFQR
jgi:hypothetical protein